jgi:hypothetical protein
LNQCGIPVIYEYFEYFIHVHKKKKKIIKEMKVEFDFIFNAFMMTFHWTA